MLTATSWLARSFSVHPFVAIVLGAMAAGGLADTSLVGIDEVHRPVGAAIRGVVVGDGTPAQQPIARAILTLTREGVADGPINTTETDDSGRFEFSSVSSGRYLIAADKPGYVSAVFGSPRPGVPGTPVVVTDQQDLNELRIVLHRGAVIAGTVLGSNGRAAAGITVSVLRGRLKPNGMSRLEIPIGAGEPGVQSRVVTDTAGRFRLYGLPPGRYVLRAHSVDETTTPPTFLTTYYPGTPDPSVAEIITLDSADERAVTLVLQPAGGARIQGIVQGPSVRGHQLRVAIDQREPIESFLNGFLADASGRFTFQGVMPGTYVVQARSRATGGSPEILWGQTTISLSGQDVSGVVVTLAPARTLSGRIVLEPPSPAGVPSQSRVTLVPMYPWQRDPALTAQVDRAGNFMVDGVAPGRYEVTASISGLSAGATSWKVTSMVHNGQELWDSILEVGPEDRLSDLAIAMSALRQEITGTLTNADGRPAIDLTVLVFPTNQRLWGTSATRVRLLRPATDSTFAATDLAAGEYFVVALTNPEPDDLVDANYLATLARTSLRVILKPGERKVLHLRAGD